MTPGEVLHMGFGNNPFVSKAQVAEQKARDAGDAGARERAWRDAARLWERAAEREMEAKRRAQYEQNAEQARAQAEGGDDPAVERETESATETPSKVGAPVPARTALPPSKPN